MKQKELKNRVLSLTLAALLTVPGFSGVGLDASAADLPTETKLAAAAESELPFTDVPESEWYYQWISDVYAKGLMKGKTATTFAPLENIVRAQFAVILYRIEKEPEVAYTEKFPDVSDGQFYTKAILWAAENGIVTGYTSGPNKGKFGVNDPITREQMATIMYRYAAYKGLYDTIATNNLDDFKDSEKVTAFSIKGVKWCAKNEIITGKGKTEAQPQGAIDPQGLAIRAECAKIISVFSDVPEDGDPLERLESMEDVYSGLEQGFYTDESYQEFQKKIENAQKVLEDPNSQLKERRAAYTELVEAREALVKEEAPADPKVPEPEKDATLPDANQYQYQKEELAAFCHFGPNTFNEVEWGEHYGTQAPSAIFTLSEDFDADTQVKTLKEAGFQKLIVTAKHHDGFCIWASEYTDYDVANTNYKDGKGDILAELSAACTKYDMDMGLYLSPWDIHDKSYGYYDANGAALVGSNGQPLNGRTWEQVEEADVNDYNEYYNNQLTEILGNDEKYGNKGHFTEVWMDGAKGSGSATQNYKFEKWFETIQKYEGKAAGYEADCMLFGAESYTTVRWIGNEDGYADDETWAKSTINRTANTIDSNKTGKQNATKGYENGNQWTVPEADARITSGWFWGNNKKTPKSMKDLANMYFNTVGHNATLLLNVPPNNKGKIDSEILQRVREFGAAVKETFDENLASRGVATASEVRGADSGFYGAQNVLDGNDDTYWTTNDGTISGTVTVKLGETKQIDVVSIEEAIRFGQRIKEFTVEYADGSDDEWKTFDSGKTIGAKRLCRRSPVKADRIRVTVKTSSAVPMLTEIGVYKAGEMFALESAPEGIDVIDIDEFTTTGSWTREEGSQYTNGTNKYATNSGTLTLEFEGTGIILLGTLDPNHGTANVTIDNGTATQINTQRSSRAVGQSIYDSGELSDGKHTLTLTVTNKAIGVEAAYVINNHGVGMIGLENASYTMDEESEITVKLFRKGGTKGEATVTLTPNPGTAIQDDFDTENIQSITFKEGETEKTATVKTTRNTNKTGDQYFTVELTTSTKGLILGLNRKAVITILDTESKTDPGTTTPTEPETPTDAYSAENPFEFPTEKGKSVTLEAEKMILHNSGEGETWPLEIKEADWASGKKFVNSLNRGGDTVTLYYKADKTGTYTVKVYYRSGSDTNTLSWSEKDGKIESGSEIIGASDASSTKTKDITWTVKTSGSGILTLQPPADQAVDSPQLDKFEITLQ